MICSSVNRLARIVRLPPGDGLYSNLAEIQGLRSYATLFTVRTDNQVTGTEQTHSEARVAEGKCSVSVDGKLAFHLFELRRQEPGTAIEQSALDLRSHRQLRGVKALARYVAVALSLGKVPHVVERMANHVAYDAIDIRESPDTPSVF